VPVTLKVNGETLKLRLEPRVTLLDALRNYSSLTGAKEGCDRASCGACTVLLGDLPIYACQKLAVEAQGQEITTVEGLAKPGKLTKVQQAFLEKDALMCGYCTPGFVMSVTALLKQNPHPTAADVKRACAGNLCRCGTNRACWRRRSPPPASPHPYGGSKWLSGPLKPNTSASLPRGWMRLPSSLVAHATARTSRPTAGSMA